MNHRFPQFSQRQNRPWQPGWILSILLLWGIGPPQPHWATISATTTNLISINQMKEHGTVKIPPYNSFLLQDATRILKQNLTHSDAAWPRSQFPSPQSKTPSAPIINPNSGAGMDLSLKGNPTAALSVYRQTLSRQPHSSRVVGLGMTLQISGKIQEAKKPWPRR